MNNQFHCPLCLQTQLTYVHQHQQAPIVGRQYWHCEACQLIHVPEHWQWQIDDEKSIYDQHQNAFGDQGYERFLQRMITPLTARLAPAAHGLDFGCGPTPVLAKLLTEQGYPCAIYDLFYYPDTQPLSATYDYVVSTEVIEHLANPRAALEQLVGMLNIGGYLALMTQTWQDLEHFRRWHYINDPTHISLFHIDTFHWIEAHFPLRLVEQSPGVFIFQHQPES